LSPSDAEALDGGDFTVESFPTLQVDWFGLQNQKAPLDDVRVRQAINFAIDRQGIVDAFYLGYATPTEQLFPAFYWAYDEESKARYDYDPERARELWADAGVDGFAMKIFLPGQDRVPLAEIL